MTEIFPEMMTEKEKLLFEKSAGMSIEEFLAIVNVAKRKSEESEPNDRTND